MIYTFGRFLFLSTPRRIESTRTITPQDNTTSSKNWRAKHVSSRQLTVRNPFSFSPYKSVLYGAEGEHWMRWEQEKRKNKEMGYTVTLNILSSAIRLLIHSAPRRNVWLDGGGDDEKRNRRTGRNERSEILGREKNNHYSLLIHSL